MNERATAAELVADGLCTIREAARFLAVARSTLYAAMGRGDLPFVRIGRCRRIPRMALLQFAARGLVAGDRRQLDASGPGGQDRPDR